MNVLVLASQVPATPSIPGSPRLYQFCRHLSRNHVLTLLVKNSQPERARLFEDDSASHGLFHRVIHLPPPHPTTWFRRQHHRVILACHLRTDLLYPDYHRKLLDFVELTLRNLGPNTILYVDGLEMTQYVRSNTNPKAIVDLHDCHSYLLAQQVRLQAGMYRRFTLWLEKRSLARWEASLHERFAAVILNSSVDEAAYRALAPSGRTLTISNGVDTDYYAPAIESHRPPVLIFTGVMDYGPNEDAAIYFCREILPRVRQAISEAQFWIVGASPPPKVRDLAIQPGVRVVGAVSDMRPYLQSARIFVCPLRYGAGMKNKVLTALAMRLPVVATPISLANIDVKPGRDVLVADAPETFARHVIGLLQDEKRAARLAERGRAVISEEYSWKHRAERLEEILSQLGAGEHPN